MRRIRAIATICGVPVAGRRENLAVIAAAHCSAHLNVSGLH
jgi:hypothetical protein